MSFFKRTKKVTAYTFKTYWSTFYFHNPQRSMIKKSDAQRLFENSNCSGAKKKAIEGITKGIKINGFEYLRSKLNKY
jgi:hypothetical protein